MHGSREKARLCRSPNSGTWPSPATSKSGAIGTYYETEIGILMIRNKIRAFLLIATLLASVNSHAGEQWSRDIDVNLTGAFRAVQACLPGMLDRGWGRIVVVASAAAQLGLAGQVAYSASKAGLLGMVKTLAVEGVGRGITANAVLPGLIATPKVLGMPDAVLKRVIDELPMRRAAEPAEVASLVGYLATEQAAYITGQDVRIDGGLGLQHATLGSTR